MKYFFCKLMMSLVVLGSMLGLGPGPGDEQGSYIFSYLVLDAPEKLDEAERNEAMRGHFSNMGVLTERGDLLIAGPLAEPRIDETYRGIFVFNAATPERGAELVATDPAVAAGVFKPELYTLVTDAPLRELTRLEKEAEARRLADPEIPDEWVGRAYVLAMGPVNAGFTDSDAVLVASTITPVDAESDAGPRRLLWLDAVSVEEAKNKFGADDLDAWSFYGWYGSGTVAELGGVEEAEQPGNSD
ncbi:MAG: YciI family protein [Phycisphaerales bacterium]